MSSVRADRAGSRRVGIVALYSFDGLRLWVLDVVAAECVLPLLVLVVFVYDYRGRVSFGGTTHPPGLVVGTLVGTSDAGGVLCLGGAKRCMVDSIAGTDMRIQMGSMLIRAPGTVPVPAKSFMSLRGHFLVAAGFRPKSGMHVSTHARSKRFRT